MFFSAKQFCKMDRTIKLRPVTVLYFTYLFNLHNSIPNQSSKLIKSIRLGPCIEGSFLCYNCFFEEADPIKGGQALKLFLFWLYNVLSSKRFTFCKMKLETYKIVFFNSFSYFLFRSHMVYVIH